MNARRVLHGCFIGTNIIIAITGLCYLIYLNTRSHNYYYWSNGSFIGGYSPSIALFFTIYGSISIYGLYRSNSLCIMAHGGLAVLSLVVRIATFCMISMHGYAIPVEHYLYLVAEVVIVLFFLLSVKLTVHTVQTT